MCFCPSLFGCVLPACSPLGLTLALPVEPPMPEPSVAFNEARGEAGPERAEVLGRDAKQAGQDCRVGG